MKQQTRTKFNAMATSIAAMNGATSPTEQFAVDPSVSQTMEQRIVEQADFLGEIGIYEVDELTGEKIGVGVSNPIAKRTDTTTKDREPTSVHSLDKQVYKLNPVEYDTSIGYATLDAWAKQDNFEILVRNAIIERIAMDRLMTGWTGTSAAVESDPVANPLRQDMNIGWLQHIRDNAPEQMAPTGLKVGDMAGADYKNFDELIIDMNDSLLAPWVRGKTGIQAICDSGLITEKFMSMAADHEAPTEKAALQTMISNRVLGGRMAKHVPYFPTRSILLCEPKTLSIYWQGQSRRRQIVDEPRRNRIADYQSVNEGYVVEDYPSVAFVEGILIPNAAKDAWI